MFSAKAMPLEKVKSRRTTGWVRHDPREAYCHPEFNYCTEFTDDKPRETVGTSICLACSLATSSCGQSKQSEWLNLPPKP